MLKLISWNVLQGGGYRLARQVEVLGAKQVDVVALQEVTAKTAPLFRDALLRHGLAHVRHSFGIHRDHRNRPKCFQRRTRGRKSRRALWTLNCMRLERLPRLSSAKA